MSLFFKLFVPWARLAFVLFISTLLAGSCLAQNGDKNKRPRERRSPQKNRWTQSDPPPQFPSPKGQRLRELVARQGAHALVVGASTSIRMWGTESETILDREFGYVTPTNEFKQSAVHPQPGVWKWNKADAWVAHCQKHRQIMRLHAPISPQCSDWAKDDSRTAEELKQNMEEYMTTLCKRYNGVAHVRWMDVVNETVTREGEWFSPKEGIDSWENPWPQIGFDETDPLRPPLYIKRAFEIANRHAPKIKLIYNQHGGMEKPMWRKVCKTILYLRKQGLRVDGVGWQAHIDVGFEKDPENMKNLNALIAWAHRHDLEFHVTENNVWLKKDRQGDYEAQAATFRAILETLMAHRKTGVVTWNAWLVRDNEGKHPDWEGTLFNAEGQPKASYYAIQQVLRNRRSSKKRGER